MGEIPYWYYVLKAAEYYRCKPWELLNKPRVWIDLAIIAMAAEGHAAKQKRNRQSR